MFNRQALFKLQTMLSNEKPQKADVIVWLQGDRFDRAEKVCALFSSGYASKIILTGNDALIGPGQRVGEDNVSLSAMKEWLLKRGVPEDAVAIGAQSYNTRDQAVSVLAAAQKNDWNTLLLVGSTHHQLRAFLTFIKRAEEIGWKGRVINQPAFVAASDVPGGRTMRAGEIFEEEIAKLDRYVDHVATLEQGFMWLKNNFKLFFRLATEADANQLFEWRNNPEVYAHFFTPHPVLWNEHVEWLRQVMLDENRELYIIYDGDRAIGQIRFDKQGNSSEVSITVDPSLHGKGYGSRMVEEGTILYLDKHQDVAVVVARIVATHLASQRVFIKAGYKEKERSKDLVVLSFLREYAQSPQP